MGATTTFKSYSCPECNAPLSVDEAAERVKCTYCGHSFDVRRAQPTPPPSAIAPATVNTTTTTAPRSSSFLRWLSVMPFSILVLIYFVIHRPPVLSTVNNVVSGARGLQWDALAPGPILADVDGDGFEDFIGRCRSITPDELWVVAFAGANLRSRWRIGPLGDWNAREAVRFAVAGRRVLVTDGHHTARVIDLGSGKLLGTIALSDHAGEVCGDPSATRFFVATSDGEQFFVEGDPPARHEGKRPSWCAKPGAFASLPAAVRRRVAAGDPLASHETHAPRIPGFESLFVLREGERAVAVGEKHPGTALPMLAGFSAGHSAADWSRVLPTVDPAEVNAGAVDVATLANGTLYAYYPLTSLRGGRVIAVDAANGVTRWDVVLPHADTGSAPEMIVAGARRVYVPHWSWLDVLDSATGAVIGTVGN